MPHFQGTYPANSSPVTVFAGLQTDVRAAFGDFGAPNIAMRGPAKQDYYQYPYRRDFGIPGWNQGRGFGDAAPEENGIQDYIQLAIQGVGQVAELIKAWNGANAQGKQQLSQSVAQQTGLTPEQIQLYFQQQAAAQNKTPAWVLPVAIGAGVIGLGAIVVLATGRRR